MSPLSGIWSASLSLLLLLSSAAEAARKPSNAVLLSTVKSLTFYNGKKTTGRRLDPIPQMSCSGGSAKGLFTPDVIRCLNSGSSYSSEDVEWTCTASLPPEFKLGSTDVICEGYESAKDDYVLKGSCAVEYRLVLTDIGEEKYGSSWTRGFRQSGAEGGTSPFVATLFWVLFVGVAAWMIYSAFVRRTNNTGNIPRSWGGGGGGGGGGGDDPPPPYTPYFSKPKNSSNNSSRQYPRSTTAGQQQEGWRPGFWSGAAAGAAGAWYAASRRQQPQVPQRTSSWWGGSDPMEGSSTGRRSGAASQSYSAERHTSTGFGGTRRR